jgi:hypothetical protein
MENYQRTGEEPVEKESIIIPQVWILCSEREEREGSKYRKKNLKN